MSNQAPPSLVVYCHCANTDLVPDEKRRRALQALAGAGVRVEAVPDLCGLAARRDPRLVAWFGGGPVLVVACYPRTIRWLLQYAGVSPLAHLTFVNLRNEPAEAVQAALPRASESTAAQVQAPARDANQWIPWFPVIDYDRCTQCRQCLSFCPFGVYELDSGRVAVRNPANCKNNCPACARICPQVAIVFPKVKDSPINGNEVTQEDVARQRKSAVEGETDLHALLARRRLKAAAGRFARNVGQPGAGAAGAPEKT
jgi:NAD-dependent dihydropyrimidine dehydrogenase PreA subunit